MTFIRITADENRATEIHTQTARRGYQLRFSLLAAYSANVRAGYPHVYASVPSA
jgi:hypothetical protein